MNADDQTTSPSPGVSRRGFRRIGRRILLRALGPYARHRAETVSTMARLEAELEHVRERHTEQIERLEDLVRELILTIETLRRSVASREDGGGQ